MIKKPIVIQESPLHYWFELSYASYLVMPRLLLENMPIAWQEKLVKLLDQIPEKLKIYDHYTGNYTVNYKVRGKFAVDPYKDYRRGHVDKK